jgi:hypothetical protein
MKNNGGEAPRNLTTGRLILFLAILSFGGLFLFQQYKKRIGDYTFIPKELKINYMPADFQFVVDEERALEVLANPQRHRREFDRLIYDLNIAVINHVANRMGLDSELQAQARKEYDKRHGEMANLYFQDFVSIMDTTSSLYQTWYNNESLTAAAVLREVASKYTCFLVNHIMTTVIGVTEDGSIFARGRGVDTPCGIALTEALQPLIKRMEERAAIRDFGRSRGLLQEKVERVIAELATMEVRDKKGINKRMQTKLGGFAVSSTDIDIVAISVLKVGFRLDDYFDIRLNSRNGVVTVTLPEPAILSHEVYPRFDKLSIGWLREVKDDDLNKAFNALRGEFRREALASDIMEKSKARAIELMNTMFTPMLSAMNRNYKLKVEFRKDAQTPREEFAADEFKN